MEFKFNRLGQTQFPDDNFMYSDIGDVEDCFFCDEAPNSSLTGDDDFDRREVKGAVVSVLSALELFAEQVSKD